MINKIIRFTQKNGMFQNCTGIVVGVSGGPDSMALLDILVKNKNLFPFGLVCATVNHKLRPEATEEAEKVAEYCKQNGVPFELLSADVRKDCPKGVSLEDYSRQVRYRFFEDLKQKYAYSHAATAHTADDNCESRMLNLIRGCGTDGLKGIAPLREDNTARPLLCCEKKELIDYCDSNKIVYSIDSSNLENIYKRNIIRNKIIPEIKTLNPDFPSALERLAATTEKESDFLREETEKLREKAQLGKNPLTFSLGVLKTAHPALLCRLLRNAAKETGGETANFQMTEELLNLVRNGASASRAEFFGGFAQISFDQMLFCKGQTKIPTFFPFTPTEGDNPIGETGATLRLTKTVYDGKAKNCICFLPFSQLTVRPRKEGDYLRPENRPTGGRSLKRLLCDKRIPVFKREQIPLIITQNGEILWTGLSGREAGAIPLKNEECIQIEMIETE